MGHAQHDYAVTLTGSEADLPTFEKALDVVPEGAMIGAPGYDAAALVFTVTAATPSLALENAVRLLNRYDVPIPNGASLSVLEHESAAA